MFKAKHLELNLIFNAKMSKENKIYVKFNSFKHFFSISNFFFATFFKSWIL